MTSGGSMSGWSFSPKMRFTRVPPTDVPEGDSRNTLFIIADDAVRIRSRVKQLLGKAAWSENPRSRTRRMIANVRVVGADGDSILVTANFAVHRMRYESVDTYIGHYDYKLVRAGSRTQNPGEKSYPR